MAYAVQFLWPSRLRVQHLGPHPLEANLIDPESLAMTLFRILFCVIFLIFLNLDRQVCGGASRLELGRARAIVYNGICLGVRAGAVCEAFRDDGVSSTVMHAEKVVDIVYYVSIDLLAPAAASGLEGPLGLQLLLVPLTPA